MTMLELTRTTTAAPAFRELIVRLDAELWRRYPDTQAEFAPHNVFASDTVVVARLEGAAVGCGAFKPYDASSVELKRMFVDDSRRGAGIGAAIVRELEAWARELGYRAAVLETGDRQPEAVALYRKCGYEVTANYGPYVDMVTHCMRRQL